MYINFVYYIPFQVEKIGLPASFVEGVLWDGFHMMYPGKNTQSTMVVVNFSIV